MVVGWNRQPGGQNKLNTARIIQEINGEIARLVSARDILAKTDSTARPRPSGGNHSMHRTAKRGRLTAAGRKRLSELMKKRWAERRKKASAKTK